MNENVILIHFKFDVCFFFHLWPGSIDEVEQMVHMTWVQPRVLDLNQVTYICNLVNYLSLRTANSQSVA